MIRYWIRATLLSEERTWSKIWSLQQRPIICFGEALGWVVDGRRIQVGPVWIYIYKLTDALFVAKSKLKLNSWYHLSRCSLICVSCFVVSPVVPQTTKFWATKAGISCCIKSTTFSTSSATPSTWLSHC